MAVLLGFLLSWWLLAGPRNALYVLAGPWSAEWSHGRTPMPILAVALPGGALFWVVIVFHYLSRWEPQASFFRSAALVGFAASWLFVGFVELALEPLL